MPNHVTTVLEIADTGGTPLADIHAMMLGEDRKIDFDTIKPMPSCLKDFEPHTGIISRAKMALGLLDEPNRNPTDIVAILANLAFSNAMREASSPCRKDDIAAVIRAIQNYAECGYLYWYDWTNDEWGTKWGAYGQPDDGFPTDAIRFEFQTAWSHPFDILALLSRRLPGVAFSVQYADEDLGCNCGTYTLKAGVRSDEDIAPAHADQTPDDRKRFTAMAFRLNYGDVDPASHGYGEDWEYSDEIYEAHEAAQAAQL